MTILTYPSRTARHRVGRRASHGRGDWPRAAVRAAHAPVDRVQAALLGYSAGLGSGLLAVALLWIGAR